MSIMCPLWPLHTFIIYMLALGPLWLMSTTAMTHTMNVQFWNVSFEPKELLCISIDSINTVLFSTQDLSPSEIQTGVVNVVVQNIGIPSVRPIEKMYVLNTEVIDKENSEWSSAFNITTNFLGYANARLQLNNKSDGKLIKESNPLNITVIREEGPLEKAFTYSVIILVTIIYINFGCALDTNIVQKTVKKPIGPIIGFVSQFLLMPLISYGLAKSLFPHTVAMQLGLFFTGVSPAGGASNIWTVTLGGNMNLSLTMTTISTFAAFAMIPFWIFTLGQLIFASGNITIPYSRIAFFASSLVVPLGIGLALQKYQPRIAKFMARILRPFSSVLILFICVFAIISNFYIFKLFSWQIVVAGLGLPWLGFIFGAAVATLLKQVPADILAIAIETGIQNTGIAILMLKVSLGQPEADLTQVVPVAVAIMTPLPLASWYIVKKLHVFYSQKKNIRLESDDVGDTSRIETLNNRNLQSISHK